MINKPPWWNSADTPDLKYHELYGDIIDLFSNKNAGSVRALDNMVSCLSTIAEDEIFLNRTQKGENNKMPFIDYSKDRVFIVHGHDNEAKEMCARFLSVLG